MKTINLWERGDRAVYRQVNSDAIWSFREGKNATVLRDQEPGDVSVKVRFDDETEPVYPYAFNLQPWNEG